MSTPDDVWEWIRPPLEELKQGDNADPDMPWEERRQTFLRELELSDASQHPVVELLLQRLDESPEEERNRILGSDELNSMAYQLAQEHGAGQEAAGGEAAYDEAAPYDEQAWQAYLAENGPLWDGTEDSWEQFRDWFAYDAGQHGLSTPAAALLDYLTPQPAADRIATFAQYGVTITAPEQAAWADEAAPAPAEEEPAAQAQAGPGPGEQEEPGQQPGQEPQRPDLTPQQIESIMDQVLAQNKEFEKISAERRKELMDQVLGGR
jgi:hypothetical protein